MIILLLASAALAGELPSNAPIDVVGHTWAPFISPMGEPFRARTSSDDTLARWFNQADRNHDSLLTADEMQADADRYFAILDTDKDGEIGPEELINYEWELAPDIQVNSKLKRAPGEISAAKVDDSDKSDGGVRRRHGGEAEFMEAGLEGAARYGLLNMPEPVAAADADFNRSISRAEFRQAALARFTLLDGMHQGKLTLQALQGLRSTVLASLRQPKHRKSGLDSRIGAPLPPEQ